MGLGCTRHEAPATGRHGPRALNSTRKMPLQEKEVQESDPDLVAGLGCFLGPAFKALPVPPNSPRRGVSLSDEDPVLNSDIIFNS